MEFILHQFNKWSLIYPWTEYLLIPLLTIDRLFVISKRVAHCSVTPPSLSTKIIKGWIYWTTKPQNEQLNDECLLHLSMVIWSQYIRMFSGINLFLLLELVRALHSTLPECESEWREHKKRRKSVTWKVESVIVPFRIGNNSVIVEGEHTFKSFCMNRSDTSWNYLPYHC